MPSIPQPATSSSPPRLVEVSLPARVETKIRRVVLSWPAAACVLLVLLVLLDGLRTSLPVQVSGEQKDLYILFAGLSTTLLGFNLAALTFLVSLPEDRPLLQRIRNEGHHAEILRRFARGCAYLGLVVVVSIVCLIVDRQPQDQLTAHTLGTGSYFIWLLAAAAIPAAVSLARSLHALMLVIPVVIAAGRTRR
jgi:hypothetical protein